MNIFKTKIEFFVFCLFAIYVLPWIILGQDSFILIHDNLDSNLIWYKTLLESKTLFADNYATLPMFMNAPRVAFGSEFNVQVLLYYLFEPYSAYVLNQIFIRIIAFFGMYFLLKCYIFKQEHDTYSLFIALLYGTLPFWPSGGLSVAGLPLITYVFLNIRNNLSGNKDWILLIIFPFYSSFVLSMMFYVILLIGVAFYDTCKRNLNRKFLFSIVLFGAIYLFVNYRLLETFLFQGEFVSHRVEMANEYFGFVTAVFVSIKHFIFGQYHAHSIHIIFLPFVCVVFLANFFF